MRRNSTVRELDLIAAKIRRTVLEMSRVRGGYAAQGVALADIAATLYFDEMRPDGDGWYKDRFDEDGSDVDQSPIEGQLGFEITAGSLGQGPSQSAGLSWALRQQGSDKRVYCLFSDGELQEGNTWEGAMFAGHQKLANLCYIVDNNDMQASGHARDVMSVEPVPEKFEAFGFKARRISGTDIPELLDTFAEARATTDRPFVMICDTRLWDGIDCLQKALPMAHYTAKNAVDWDAGLAEINAKIAELEA